MPRRLRNLINSSQGVVNKGDLLLDTVIDLVDKLEDDGIEVTVNLFGKDIPATLKLKLGEDEDALPRLSK